MNAITRQESNSLPSLHASEEELIKVLQTSIYPGAQIESIKMALGYCKAAGLDPLQKPVHIVPMWDSKAGQNRDVIMPGVGLYRTQAARNGCAGVSEPEFGPSVTEIIDNVSVTYPDWCRVTVKRRLATGEIVDFTAVEFWKENYAVKGGKERSIAPNSMWMKRPKGQIAKCAEAQALRKAFPEVGSMPTADEMEGKQIEDTSTTIDSVTGEIITQKKEAPRALKETCSEEKFNTNKTAWREMVKSGSKTTKQLISFLSTKTTFTEDQLIEIDSWNYEE